MLSTRWNPRDMWSEMLRLQREMDHLLGRPNGSQGQAAIAFPPLNLWEDDDKLFVEAELAGFNLEDLEITVSGSNQLTLKGERKEPETGEGTWHRRERGYGSFNRVIELPEPVAADKVTAHFKHGVLTIELPKSEEAKPRRIEVKGS